MSTRVLIFLIMLQVVSGSLYSQQVTPEDTVSLANGTDGLTFLPRKSDSTYLKVSSDLPFNEFTGIYSTFKIGAGYIGDFTAYSQNAIFKQQMDSLGVELAPTFETRDFRIIASGRLLKSKRHIAYRFAYMYDGDNRDYGQRSGAKGNLLCWSHQRRVFDDQSYEWSFRHWQ
jgi:phosphate-selective porin OprO/OprP